ncbi:DUF5776 domain-containing protein [Lentilactobacillus sp. SPB1-3]|uniref:DUF5776 domain-containing protein n=1 Tax=Lentilactobacillus terminaliae TaxID=3003483 RepID=A0ACD5DDS6_9LACO|nr:DUF5776 domain-containing protein [Lentilactobacillus sp. SPB1-3]MCZ0977626.1 DUF5776 domain-containing protein [Lentilactobacillus sp. SPB1-3]
MKTTNSNYFVKRLATFVLTLLLVIAGVAISGANSRADATATDNAITGGETQVLPTNSNGDHFATFSVNVGDSSAIANAQDAKVFVDFANVDKTLVQKDSYNAEFKLTNNSTTEWSVFDIISTPLNQSPNTYATSVDTSKFQAPDGVTISGDAKTITVQTKIQPKSSLTVTIPLKVDTAKLTAGNPEDQWNIIDYTTYGQTMLQVDFRDILYKSVNDLANGKYLITTYDKGTQTFKQVKDLQSQMPEIGAANEITFDNTNKGFGKANDPVLYQGGSYYVDINAMKDASNQESIKDMLQANGYTVPSDENGVMRKDFAFTTQPSASTPGTDTTTVLDGDGNKTSFNQLLNHNGLGDINFQALQVIDTDNVNTNDADGKWNALNNLVVYAPNQENQDKKLTNSDIFNSGDNNKGNLTVTVDGGATIDKDGNLTNTKPGTTYNVTYHYSQDGYNDIRKTIKVTTPGGGSSSNPGNGNVTNPSNPGTGSNNTGNGNVTNPSNPGSGSNNSGNSNVTNPGTIQKNIAVIMNKGGYLYKTTSLGKSGRIYYKAGTRQQRPMFVVTRIVDSKNGLLYQVRDANAKFVNSNKKTNGKVGYIKATKNVVPAYYSTKKVKYFKVINKKGINGYKNVNLTSKAKHYKYGTKVRVVSQKVHNLTMRYKLSNGTYISANKKLVAIYK